MLKPPVPPAHMSKFWQGCSSYFLGLKFGQILFFWVGNFLAIFLGFAKFPLFFWVWQISSYFLGLPVFCITHLNPSNEEHTVLKNKIIVASYLFKLGQPLHLESFYFFGFEFWSILFFGFEFRVILFFWVVEICSRTSIPVKEMLLCPPPPRAPAPPSLLIKQ